MEKITNNQRIIGLSAVIILVVLVAGFMRLTLQKQNTEVVSQTITQQVKVMPIGANTKLGNYTTEGTIKAASKVDIIAMANGTAKAVNFKVGDKVIVNQSLVYLQDEVLATNYANSSLNYANVSQNQGNTRALTDEMIKQAGLNVDRSKEMLDAAKINYETVKLNLANVKDLQEKNKEDMRNNAIISIANYSNTINSALDQINTIYGINAFQLDGLADTLAVKNNQALGNGKTSYQTARDDYTSFVQKNFSSAQAELALTETINALTKTKKAADDAILVLAATISSARFSEASLNLQKISFNQLRATLVGSISAVQANLQALQNINLANKRELDGLASALKAAQNQIAQAQLGVDNANSALINSKQSKDQQLLMSKTSLDGARGQLSVLATQLSDLNIKAPIAGQITMKAIEPGTEVRVGQKVGEIAQINTVKILVQLAPEDATQIKLGGTVAITGGLKGIINNIAPVADSLTKKIQIEIVADNKDKTLRPETLVTLNLPISSDKIATHEFNVPLQAVTVTQNETYIFTADKNKAKKEKVELVTVDGELATIRVKLSGKSLIITDGNKLLKDGDAIIIN